MKRPPYKRATRQFVSSPGYWPDRIGEFPGSCKDPSEPAVLGGLMTPFAVIPVSAKGLLLAVFTPWLLPPNMRNAINTTAAISVLRCEARLEAREDCRD